MSDPTYPLFSVFSFLGFVAVLIPFPWHLEAWNSGTCYYMLWTGLSCLNAFVNSVIWRNNALNPAPIWCDISTRIMIASSVGIPAASLCINRRLFNIARMQAVSITRSEKRRDILIDTCICVILPLICLVLAYVVQGHRFTIFEEIGCFPAEYNTLPTYFLLYSWPLLCGMTSFVYCSLSLRIFFQRRAQMSEFLSSNSSLTASRYFRLMALATTEMLFTTPLAIVVIYLNASSAPLQPWISWSDTHFDFNRVDQVPSVLWRPEYILAVGLELNRWVLPACAFIFFAFFGFAAEARRHYRLAFWAVANRFGYTHRKSSGPSYTFGYSRSQLPTTTMSSVGTLPAYVTPPRGYAKHPDSSTSTVFGQFSKPSHDGHSTVFVPITKATSPHPSLPSLPPSPTDAHMV